MSETIKQLVPVSGAWYAVCASFANGVKVHREDTQFRKDDLVADAIRLENIPLIAWALVETPSLDQCPGHSYVTGICITDGGPMICGSLDYLKTPLSFIGFCQESELEAKAGFFLEIARHNVPIEEIHRRMDRAPRESFPREIPPEKIN